MGETVAISFPIIIFGYTWDKNGEIISFELDSNDQYSSLIEISTAQ